MASSWPVHILWDELHKMKLRLHCPGHITMWQSKFNQWKRLRIAVISWFNSYFFLGNNCYTLFGGSLSDYFFYWERCVCGLRSPSFDIMGPSTTIEIQAWISNHMPNNMWADITYPFSHLTRRTIEVWERVNNFIPHFTMDVIIYPCWDEN